jgi:hypothetical protein
VGIRNSKMDKHLLDRPHPYNFITIHRGSQNIFTQARLNNKQSTIKCRQQTLAEAAWGADVVHDAVREPQSGAPIRKLNFPSAEDAVAALVQEAGCSREEAQCRVSCEVVGSVVTIRCDLRPSMLTC